MSFLKNKLFRWKQKQRIPKKEWPELVGKVTYFNFEFFSTGDMGTKSLARNVLRENEHR